MKWFISIIALGLFVLSGCAIEESEDEDAVTEEAFDSFALQAMSVNWDDVDTPILYIIAPEEAESQVRISRNKLENEKVQGSEESIHELEDTTVNDEEIIIQYDGQEDRFERLSESVAKDENGERYEYIGSRE